MEYALSPGILNLIQNLFSVTFGKLLFFANLLLPRYCQVHVCDARQNDLVEAAISDNYKSACRKSPNYVVPSQNELTCNSCDCSAGINE